MYEILKRHTNRHTVGVALVYANLLFLCYHLGARGAFIALVLGPAIIGGFWLWMRSPLSTCECGKVTAFAGRCPCGGPVQQKRLPFLPAEGWEERPREN